MKSQDLMDFHRMKRMGARLLRATTAIVSLWLVGMTVVDDLHAQSPEWAATLMAPAFPAAQIAEWERNPQSLVLHLTYTGQVAREYRVMATLRGQGRGELVRVESPLLSILPGPTTERLTTADLFGWRVIPAHRGDVADALRSGVIPEGDYEICAQVMSPRGLQLDESCTSLTIINPERPELIYPLSGDPVTVSQPTFQWTPVPVPPAIGVTYRLRIVERLPGQSPQTAFTANRTHFEEEIAGIPLFLFPVDALPLEEGKEYLWRVEALDGSGAPLAAGGLKSEIWSFTYRGLDDTLGGIALEDGEFPDEFTLIPGVARLAGLQGVRRESGPFGVVLNGEARLEIDAPYIGSARVRLQDLEVDAFGGELRARSGRFVGELSPGLIPDDLLGSYAKLDRVEYTPAEGLRVGGSVQLPGTDRKVRLAGDAFLTGAGIFGVLEVSTPASQPLLEVDGGPASLRIDGVRVRLPEGKIDLAGDLSLFGSPADCGDLRGQIDDEGIWQASLLCGGSLPVPLTAGGEGAQMMVHAASGHLAFSLEGEVPALPDAPVAAVGAGPVGVELAHELRVSASIGLDVGAAGICGSSFDLRLSNGEAEFGNIDTRCDGGVRSDADWLSFGLSNLRVERLGWTMESGFDLEMLVDLDPSIPALPELRLPSFHDVAIDSDGLSVPAVDEDVGPLEVNAGGFGMRVTHVRTPGFRLSWADWSAQRAGDASFSLDAEFSVPRLRGPAPVCLSSGFPATSATLAGGTLTLDFEEQSYSPGECAFVLAPSIELEIERIRGGFELALSGSPALERLPELTGSLSLPEIFRCTGSELGEVAAGDAADQGRGERLALSGGVRLGPEGELSGRVDGVFPPCPISFAGIDIELKEAALEFGGDAEAHSLVMSGGAEASFALGADPVAGSGTVELDLIAGRLIGGALEFTGPLDFGLPRDAPLFNFSLAGARLDSEGLRIDGRHDLVLPSGDRIRTTFDNLVIDPDGLAIREGRILFAQPFALEVGLSEEGGLRWGTRELDSEEAMYTGARVELPGEVWLDAEGLSVSGVSGADLFFAGSEIGGLEAVFIDEFGVQLSPIGVRSGRLEVRLEDVALATIDADGFHPNLAYLGLSVLPERLGLPDASLAYLELRDEDGELRVETEDVEAGVRFFTRPGELIPFVLPAIQFGAPVAPEILVGFDLTMNELGFIIDGSMEASIPTDQASLFDLRRVGLPFAIDSLSYRPGEDRGYAMVFAGQLDLAGGLTEGSGTVRLELNTAGQLLGSLAVESAWTLDLIPGSDGLRFAFEGMRGDLAIDLETRQVEWDLDLSGGLELAVGAGEPYRVGASLNTRHNGLDLDLDAQLPELLSFFDLGDLRLGIGQLTVPSLEYDEVIGWDFEVGFDLTFDFPELGGLTLPAIEDVRLGRSGLSLPQVELDLTALGVESFELAGFELKPFSFQMDPLDLDLLAGELPALGDWGFRFGLDLSFGELPEWAPAELRDLRLSVLDAGFSAGGFTGDIEILGLNPGPGIPLPLGDAGMVLNLLELAGSLWEDSGEQRIEVSATASWSLPEFMRCDAVEGPIHLSDASIVLDGAAGVSGRVSGLAPECPLEFGPLALQATESELVFDIGPDGQVVELEMEGRLRLPGLREGEVVEAVGELAVDLLSPRVVRGGIAVTEPFRWGLPIANPFLTFAVTDARLGEGGFIISGAGSVQLGEDASVGVGFDDLTFSISELGIVGGSAYIEGGLALDATIGERLEWVARLADSPRPDGAGLRFTVPEGARLDRYGLMLSGTAAGEVNFNEESFAALAVEFSDEFRLAFDPLGIDTGRAGFVLDGTEIAYLDSEGFWPGNLFGLVDIPGQLGLPTSEVAYLQLRDPNTDELLVETEMVDEGLRLGTVQGGSVALVIPALTGTGEAPPEVRASFEVIVNPSTFSFASGSIVVEVSEEMESLIDRDRLGLPLEVRRLVFDRDDDRGYGLSLDARLDLPDALGELVIDFEDIQVTEDGLSGEILLGSFREGYTPGTGSLAALGSADQLALELLGARATFGADPSVELAGQLVTRLVSDEGGDAVPIGFTAGAGLEGLSFAVETDAFRDSRLPLGAAAFELEKLSEEHDPLEVIVGSEHIRIRLDGILRVPSLHEEFGVAIAGLVVGTDGVTLPSVAVDLPEEWQRFELFGSTFTIAGEGDDPGLVLDYVQRQGRRVLVLTLSGEIEFLDNTTRFRGLSIATDGSIALREANLLSDPILLANGVLEITQIGIAQMQMQVDFAVNELPTPFDDLGRQEGSISISRTGEISGGARVELIRDTGGLRDGGAANQLEVDPLTLHLRYLAVELNLGKHRSSPGGIDLIADVYVGGEEQKRIRIGDLAGGVAKPGLTIGFDGSLDWGHFTAPEFEFDFNVLRVRLTEVTVGKAEEGEAARFSVSFSGELSVNVAAVSGGLKFEDFRINDQLEIDFAPERVTGSELKIAGVLTLELSGFDYSSGGRKIEVPAGEMPTGGSNDVVADVREIEVDSYLRFGGRIGVIGLEAGVENFLFYQTSEGNSLETVILIEGAEILINNVMNITADMFFRQDGEGFKLMVGASAWFLTEDYGGTVVGMIERGRETRAGLFVKVNANVPIVPGALFLSGIGGGFFYNAEQSDINWVRSQVGMGPIDTSRSGREAGRFTGMLFASAVVVDRHLAQASVLITADENHFRLDGTMGILSVTGQVRDARIKGEMNLEVGFKRKYAEGNFELNVEFQPLLYTPQDRPIKLEFFVYGKEEWGVYGEGGLRYMAGSISGDGFFVVGPKGFLVNASLQAKIDVKIIKIEAGMEIAAWMLNDPAGRELGGFLRTWAEISVILTCGANVTGAIISEPNVPIYIYGGAMGYCEIPLKKEPLQQAVWIKYQNREWDGGIGSDPVLDQVIARANAVSEALMGTVDETLALVEEGPPPPEVITISADALAEAYLRFQAMHPVAVGLYTFFALATEIGAYGHSQHYDPVPGEEEYMSSYLALLRQQDAPTLEGGIELEAYRDSVSAMIAEINQRSVVVRDRLNTIVGAMVEASDLADREWPTESPLTRSSFVRDHRANLVVVGEDTIKTLESGPDFEVDQALAAEQTREFIGLQAEVAALAAQTRSQIEELEGALQNLRSVLTATDESSILAYSQLHADAVGLAEEQYARHGDLLLRKEDWLRTQHSLLGTGDATINRILVAKNERLRDTRRRGYSADAVAELAKNRAFLLSRIVEDYSIESDFLATAEEMPKDSRWFDDQAIEFGYAIWYTLVYNGLEAAADAAEAEYDVVYREMQDRLPQMHDRVVQLTEQYDELYLHQADLIGALHDLYDRYAIWIEGQSGLQDELARVLARKEELAQELTVPQVARLEVHSTPEGYLTEERLTWSGQHPSQHIYEYLYRTNTPGLDSGADIGGLMTNGPIGERTRYILTPDRGTREVSRTVRYAVRGGAGFYGQRQASYTTVFRRPKLTPSGARLKFDYESSVSVDEEDLTPPTTPQVNFSGHSSRTVYWIPSNEKIDVEWLSTDPESGIDEYEYAVGTVTDTTAIRDWTSAGGRTKVRLHELPLGRGYHRVYVRARNGAGLMSERAGASPYFRIDSRHPSFPEDEGLRRQAVYYLAPPAPDTLAACAPPDALASYRSTGPFPTYALPPEEPKRIEPLAQFHVPEATAGVSGLSTYLWRVTTGGPAQYRGRDGWNELSPQVGQSSLLQIAGSPLTYGRDYYLTVVGLSGAGLPSEPISMKFRVADPTPPVAARFCVAQASDASGLTLRIRVPAKDPESGVSRYQYRIRRANGTTLRGWTVLKDVKADAEISVSVSNLVSGTSYYVDIRATNGEGQETVTTSGPLLFDSSPPATPTLDRIQVRSEAGQPGRYRVTARVNVPADPHSGTPAWGWKITGPMSRAGDFITTGDGQGSDVQARSGKTNEMVWVGELKPETAYRLLLISSNGAGLASKVRTIYFTTEGQISSSELDAYLEDASSLFTVTGAAGGFRLW